MPPEPAKLAGPDSHALLAAITTFNLFPARYWHDSWRVSLSAQVGAIEPALSAQPFWIRALSTAVLRERELAERFEFDFVDRAKRLALLEAPTLFRLCLALAGLRVRQHLRLLVSREDARLVQRCLGHDIHKLLLEWRDPVPLAASPPSWPEDWRTRLTDSDAWARRGVATLYSALPPESPALHGRLRLKFPIDWPDECFVAGAAPEHRELNAKVVLTLLSTFAPECSWLFADDLTIAEVAA